MSNSDDPVLGPDGGDEESGQTPSSGRSFDPIADPWDYETTDSPRAFAEGDSLFDSEVFLDIPSGSALPPEKPPADAGRPYPDRYQPGYHERLTELQRRLRQQTVTISQQQDRRWIVTVRELAETLLLAALIFLAVRASFQNFRVDGASMQPSLDNGEYLIVNKLAYASIDLGPLDWLPFVDAGDGPMNLWGEPDRGDVVVFRAPTDTGRDFIKRIIGVPGDTVEIDPEGGLVRVNGEPLNEPYARGRTTCSQQCVFIIPERDTHESRAECGSDACYFVMGDNRQNSSDSRQSWFVPQENIIGKALITYWHDGSPNIDLAPNHSVEFADPAAASDD